MRKKSFLVVVFALVMVLSSCMPVLVASPEQEKQVIYVKELPGISKDAIYKKALTWVAINYNSSNDVVQLKDQEQGQIICQGMGSFVSMLYDRYFNYTLIIDIKEEKIRLRFENIISKKVRNVSGPDVNWQWNDLKKYFDNLSNSIFEGLNEESSKDW